jgi:hypothetical protein
VRTLRKLSFHADGNSPLRGSSIAWLQVVVLAAGALFAWIFLPERAGSGETMPAERDLHGGCGRSSSALRYIPLARAWVKFPSLNGLKREMPYVSYADILYEGSMNVPQMKLLPEILYLTSN